LNTEDSNEDHAIVVYGVLRPCEPGEQVPLLSLSAGLQVIEEPETEQENAQAN
jgi:hypothetical protein